MNDNIQKYPNKSIELIHDFMPHKCPEGNAKIRLCILISTLLLMKGATTHQSKSGGFKLYLNQIGQTLTAV